MARTVAAMQYTPAAPIEPSLGDSLTENTQFLWRPHAPSLCTLGNGAIITISPISNFSRKR